MASKCRHDVAVVLWSFFYSSQFFKLMLGFVLGALAYGLLYLIPAMPAEQHLLWYIAALFLLSVSEVHIAPIIHSILTQYSNPKYLAIFISLSFLPIKLLTLIGSHFKEDLYEKPIAAALIALVVMTMVSIGLVVYNIVHKKALPYGNLSELSPAPTSE